MPPPSSVPLVPRGFVLCGLFSLLFSFAMLVLLVVMEVEGDTGRLAMAVRGAAVLLLSLALITTEALWKARPAAYPASLALAVSYLVSVPAVAAVVAAAEAELVFLQRAAFLLAASAVVVIPMLLYIRYRSRQLWPRAAVRVPAARP